MINEIHKSITLLVVMFTSPFTESIILGQVSQNLIQINLTNACIKPSHRCRAVLNTKFDSKHYAGNGRKLEFSRVKWGSH